MKPHQATYRDEVTSWASLWFPGGVQSIACYMGDLLSDILGLPLSQIKATSKFTEDLDATDLEPVEIALALKSDWGLHFSDHDAQQISTVADLVHYIHLQCGELQSGNMLKV